jgi:hypothetical protein
LFEIELDFGTAMGGGELMLVGAFVRLVAVPVPVLYWSLSPPLLQPAKAKAAHNIISVLFIDFSFLWVRCKRMQRYSNIQARQL